MGRITKLSAKQAKNETGVHVDKKTVNYLEGPKEEFYWYIINDFGRMIACSTETYSSKLRVLNTIRQVQNVFRFNFDGKYFDHTGLKVTMKKTRR